MTTNVVILDSGDDGAVANAVSLAAHLTLRTGLKTSIVYVGWYYFQDRLMVGSLDGLPDGVSYLMLQPNSSSSRNSSSVRLKDFDVFEFGMKSWLLSSLGSADGKVHGVLLPHLISVLQRHRCQRLVADFEALVNLETVGEVAIPNGRFPQELALAELCKLHGIRVTYYEKSQYLTGHVFYQEYSVHNVSAWADRASELRPSEDDYRSASEWFGARMEVGSAANVFNSSFSEGAEGVDSNYDLTLFTSSFEEFQSLVPMRLGSWENQYVAFGALIQRCADLGTCNRIALRLHPVLEKKPILQQLMEYTQIMKLLARYPALVKPFWPWSGVNSYNLAESSRIVAVMQSTIGFEASSLGKPVVALYQPDYWGVSSVEFLLDQEALDEWWPSYQPVSSGPAIQRLAQCVARDRVIPQLDLAAQGVTISRLPRRFGNELARKTQVVLAGLPFFIGRLVGPLVSRILALIASVVRNVSVSIR